MARNVGRLPCITGLHKSKNIMICVTDRAYLYATASSSQGWLKISTAEGRSAGSYLSTDRSKSKITYPSLSSSSVGFSLSNAAPIDSGGNTPSYGWLTARLKISPFVRVYLRDRGHWERSCGGKGPSRSIISNKRVSSILSWRSDDWGQGSEANKSLPVTNWYSKQPKLHISMLWSNGALNNSSGARNKFGVTG